MCVADLLYKPSTAATLSSYSSSFFEKLKKKEIEHTWVDTPIYRIYDANTFETIKFNKTGLEKPSKESALSIDSHSQDMQSVDSQDTTSSTSSQGYVTDNSPTENTQPLNNKSPVDNTMKSLTASSKNDINLLLKCFQKCFENQLALDHKMKSIPSEFEHNDDNVGEDDYFNKNMNYLDQKNISKTLYEKMEHINTKKNNLNETLEEFRSRHVT